MIKINETFFSIQGESTWAGLPTFFIRTTGCNLRCSYCDTTYAYHEGKEYSVEELVEKVLAHKAARVCVTGGEPLLQSEVHQLIRELLDKNIAVSVETSGSRLIKDVDPRAKIILDVKTPDSGAANSFDLNNLKFLQSSTEFKFVICSEDDLDWSENFCRQHQIKGQFTILYSPSYGKIDPKWLAEIILQKKSAARLQLQLHKYIWSSETRGV